MLNDIVIMGRLTRDPELRRTNNGVPVATFAIAVESDHKDKDGNRKVIFVDCVAWRGTGEFASSYFSKGRMAVVKGSLDIREWTDKEGNKRKTTEIDVDAMYFADSKKSDGSYGSNSFDEIDEDDEDLPF